MSKPRYTVEEPAAPRPKPPGTLQEVDAKGSAKQRTTSRKSAAEISTHAPHAGGVGRWLRLHHRGGPLRRFLSDGRVAHGVRQYTIRWRERGAYSSADRD